MTLQQVIISLEQIALHQPNIHSVGHNDLYRDLNSNPSIKWGYFYVTQQIHQHEGDFDRYGLNLFVIDRLINEDGDNELQVQSVAKEQLDNIIKKFCEVNDAEVYGTITYQCFTQRFSDITAGCWATVYFEVPVDSICIDE